MQRVTARAGCVAAVLALFAGPPFASPTRPPRQKVNVRVRPVATELPPPCPQARSRADQLRKELEGGVSAEARSKAESSVSNSESMPAKAWGDYAAGALLLGDVKLAAWSGLQAAAASWDGETVTNAGIYVSHLGRTQDGLLLLSCAYAMGYRSAFLFEAQALDHKKLGQTALAKEEIQQADDLEPEDPILDVETSMLKTGKPPVPRRDKRAENLDRALRELEATVRKASGNMQAAAGDIARLFPGPAAMLAGRMVDIKVRAFVQLLEESRKEVAQAKQSTTNNILYNNALQSCINTDFLVTDSLLSLPSYLENSGFAVTYWSAVMHLAPSALAEQAMEIRDNAPKASHWSGGSGPSLAGFAWKEYRQALDAARKEHSQKVAECHRIVAPPHASRAERNAATQQSRACKIHEDGAFCAKKRSLFQRVETDSVGRYDFGAHHFNRTAARVLDAAECLILDARDYAARLLREMAAPKMAEGVNVFYRNTLVEHHLTHGRSMGVTDYLDKQSAWFAHGRSTNQDWLNREAVSIDRSCETVEKREAELLAEEEWQAYREMLQDRLAGDVVFATEDEFPCEGSLGPLSYSWDATSRESKVDVKWKPKLFENKALDTSGKGSVGVSVHLGGHGGMQGSVGAGGTAGPFAGKVKITLTNMTSPWNDRDYVGIKVKGSAGFGAKFGKLGGACYPSVGSVTFYPRAILEDATRYLASGR